MTTYTFPNPAGGSMTVQGNNFTDAKTNAAAQGWNPGMGTFGANAGPDVVPQAAGGGGGTSGGGGMTAWEQQQVDAFKAGSGFSIKDLEEKRRQFDETLAWSKQMWLNQGLPALEISRRAQALAEKAQADTMQMAQANLGLDYAKTAASLGGPADYFQQSEFLRGAQATGGVPTFLNALRNNTGLASFGATGGVAPTPQTMAGLTGQLTGTAPVGNDPALAAISQIGTTGAQALAPQVLEQLSPDEMGLLQSGLRASGFSMPSFLNTYRQSRIGQGAAQAA